MASDGVITTEHFKQILGISRMLVVTTELDALLTRIAESACAMLRCERASIFLHDPKADELWTKVALHSQQIRVPSSAGIVGHAFKANKLLHVTEPYADPRFNPEPDRRSGFVTRNLLTAPMLDFDGRPVGVIQAVNKRDQPGFGPIDETLIQLLSDQAGVAIQRYNLQQAAVEAVALRREMDLAKAVQEALIPQAAPEIDGIRAVGWTQAASITGGDCYDLWRTADGRLGIFLGDATGHGIGPAMVVSQTRTLVRAMCDQGGADPRRLLACANARLAEDLDAGQFVTAVVGFLSPDGVFDYCAAGHGPLLVRRAAGEEFSALEATAPPLGIIDELDPDPPALIRLRGGGVVCIPSDGILEAFSPAGEEFGVQRLMSLLAEDCPLPDRIDRIRSAVRTWHGNDDPADDQTLVLAAKVDGKGME